MQEEKFAYDSVEAQLISLLIRSPPDTKHSKSIVDVLHCGGIYVQLLNNGYIEEYNTRNPSFASTVKFNRLLKEKKIGYFLNLEK